MSNIRWLGPIRTDLSIPLEGLTQSDIEAKIKTSTEDWAHPFATTIAEDCMNLDYGMRSPSNVTIREVAVHCYNRWCYYTARGRKDLSPMQHRLLDDLLLNGSPLEGAIPVRVCWKEGDETVREVLGRFDFASALMRENFSKRWQGMHYEPIPTDRYEVR